MSVSTRKFSQFVAANLNAANKVVGLSGGANAIFGVPTLWTTATRPSMPTNGQLGFNTDIELYEYYNSVAAEWVQLNATVEAFTWNNVTALSQAMEADNGYVANNAGLVALTLPTLCDFGQIVRVAGYGAGGWKIAFNVGQNAIVGRTVATTSVGTISSSQQYDQIELLCVVANTTFLALSVFGNLAIV
jgi:hypothetical protein